MADESGQDRNAARLRRGPGLRATDVVVPVYVSASVVEDEIGR